MILQIGKHHKPVITQLLCHRQQCLPEIGLSPPDFTGDIKQRIHAYGYGFRLHKYWHQKSRRQNTSCTQPVKASPCANTLLKFWSAAA
jgi:hypothetical protein